MISDKEIKNVVHNSSYLLITQGVAYIAPVLILGHLIKSLGVEGFGKYAICLSISAYLQVIVDYGFAFSASRHISQHRGDKAYVSRVYWATNLIKIAICIGVFPVYFCAVKFMVSEKEMQFALFSTYLLIVGNTIFPIWFYQGIEKLKIIAIVNFVSRISSCLLVIFIVKDSGDIALALSLQALPIIVGGIITNSNIIFRRYVFFTMPRFLDIKKNFIDGWDIFVATLASTVLTNSAVFILSIFSTPSVVGFYAATERIVKAVVSLFGPLTQSLYPYSCKKFGISFSSGMDAVNKTGKFLACGAFLVSILLLVGWGIIESFLKLPTGSFYIACILTGWLFFGVINNILGIQILSASGHAKSYSKIFLISASLTLILLFVLVPFFDSFGAASAVTLGETVLFLILLLKVKKLQIQFILVK